MKETLKKRCDDFVANMAIMKSSFKMERDTIRAVCASVLCDSEIEVTEEILNNNRKFLKDNTSVFSNYRGNVEAPVIAMLSTGTDSVMKFENVRKIYEILKESFRGTGYIALVAAMLADIIKVEETEKYAVKGKSLYKKMQKEHPFLTSDEDSVFAVLLALSEKEEDALITDMESSYRLLKDRFSDSNSVQSVSHVLSFYDETPEIKCGKVVALFDALKDKGLKYSKYFELSILASAAMIGVDTNTLVDEIAEVDDFLSKQDAYGFWGIDKKTRLMHATMLVTGDYQQDSFVQNNVNTSALTGTISQIASQQAAMCCAIAGITAANAAASAGH